MARNLTIYMQNIALNRQGVQVIFDNSEFNLYDQDMAFIEMTPGIGIPPDHAIFTGLDEESAYYVRSRGHDERYGWTDWSDYCYIPQQSVTTPVLLQPEADIVIEGNATQSPLISINLNLFGPDSDSLKTDHTDVFDLFIRMYVRITDPNGQIIVDDWQPDSEVNYESPVLTQSGEYKVEIMADGEQYGLTPFLTQNLNVSVVDPWADANAQIANMCTHCTSKGAKGYNSVANLAENTIYSITVQGSLANFTVKFNNGKIYIKIGNTGTVLGAQYYCNMPSDFTELTNGQTQFPAKLPYPTLNVETEYSIPICFGMAQGGYANNCVFITYKNLFLSQNFIITPTVPLCGCIDGKTNIEYPNPGNYTFTVPCGVKNVKIYSACGGGGAGGHRQDSHSHTGGGGGAAVVYNIPTPVQTGDKITIKVGKGGIGDLHQAKDGEATVISYGSTQITVPGGQSGFQGYWGGNGGKFYTDGGEAGQESQDGKRGKSSVGQIIGGYGGKNYPPSLGGQGAPRTTGQAYLGGGGGAGGWKDAGGDHDGGGGGGSLGAGGNGGGTNNTNGTNGVLGGGGGGGAVWNGGNSYSGNGGNGYVKISWELE